MNNENKTTRVHPKFKEELNDIKKKRIKDGLDKKKKSDRAITGLIIRHDYWKDIKGDIIGAENDEFEK